MEVVNPKIKEIFRHNVAFCDAMKRSQNWVTDWNRKKDGVAKPKNLPSPEEAAKMCLLLKMAPEEFLTEPADIELVRSLLPKYTPTSQGKIDVNEFMGHMDRLTYDQLLQVLAKATEALQNKSRPEKGGNK